MSWPEIRFGDLYKEPSRNGLNRPRSTRGSGYKMINMGEIFGFDRINNPDMERVQMSVTEIEKFSVHPLDLMFARQSMVEAGAGKCCVVLSTPELTCFESHIIRVRLDQERTSPLFYYYYFLSRLGRAKVESIVTGAAQKGIRGSELSELPVHYPPPSTQRRIASILSAYDDLIENNTRRIAILEEMARRIYDEWFVHFRFPGHEGGRMVESDLGPVPEGWEVIELEQACTRITDGAHHSPKTVETGRPMASVKDMHDWGIYIEQCRQISEEDYAQLIRQDCKPRVGDVLIAKDGSYLKHTFAVAEDVDVVLLSSIAMLRPNDRYRPDVLAFYLKTPEVMARMKGYVSGVAIPRIVLRDFRKFKALTPPIELQDAWLEICGSMLTLCRNLIKKNANLRAQRDLLLPKLISGEIDVSILPEPEALAA